MQWQFEQAAKTADATDAAFAQGRFNRRFDAFDEFISGVDINAGIAVTERYLGACLGIHGLLVLETVVVCYFTRLAGKCPSMKIGKQ